VNAEPLTLFDPPATGAARRRDPASSKCAARRQTDSWRSRVIQAYIEWGPMCDDLLCERLGVDPRKWPSVKTARSQVTEGTLFDAPKVLVPTNEYDAKTGQMIWRHKEWRARERDVRLVGERL
jgi:hypothetical protein